MWKDFFPPSFRSSKNFVYSLSFLTTLANALYRNLLLCEVLTSSAKLAKDFFLINLSKSKILLNDEQLAQCPILILGNKIDQVGALSESQLYLRAYDSGTADEPPP